MITPSRHRCIWNNDEKRRLLSLLEEDVLYDVIAGKLDRSCGSVEQAVFRIIKTTRRDAVGGYTRNELMQLMGINRHTFTLWRKAGLKMKRYGMKNPVWCIDHDDLVEFLENPEHWHLWSPDKIQDRELREWCLSFHHCFVTSREAAGILGYHVSRIRGLIREGKLKAVRRGYQWMVNFKELQGFTPSSSRRDVVCRRFSPEEIAELLLRLENGETPYMIAKAIGRSHSSVFSKVKELKYE